MDVQVDGKPINVDTRKAIALLVYLVVVGTPQPRDRLISLLWPDLEPERGRGALRRTLSVLRKALDGRWLVVDGDRLSFKPDDSVSVDLWELERLESVRGAHGHNRGVVCEECGPVLATTVDLFRGTFLDGFSVGGAADFEEWQRHQAADLNRTLQIELDLYAQALAGAGQYARAVEVARRRIDMSPLDEGAHRQVMLLSVWAGDRAAALRQYQTCVAVLDEELGVPPLPETSALEEAILTDHIPDSPRPSAHTRLDVVDGASTARHEMVGRSTEMRKLEECLIGDSPGTAAVISGPPGVGKSRLADEIVDAAQRAGRRAITTRAYEGEQQLGLVVVGDIVRRAIGNPADLADVDPTVIAEVSRIAPELGGDPIATSSLGRDPGAQSRFFDAVCSLVTHVLGPGGVVVLDDMQWADTASLELVAYLIRRPNRFPLSTLLIWRSPNTGESRPLLGPVTDLVGRDRGLVIELAPLGPDAIASIARQVKPNLAAEVEGSIVDGSDGIPLVALQFLRMVDETGRTLLDDIDARHRVAEVRLRGVSELGRQIVTAAAAIGRDFDIAELEGASGRTSMESVEAVDELVRAGIFHETDGQTFDFNHDLVRLHARDGTTSVRRRLLHGRVADHLMQTRRGSSGSLAGRIALHLARAGRTEESCDFHLAAGDHARSVFALDEALTHYEAALALGSGEVVRLHTGIGDLHRLAGRYAKAADSYRMALARSDESNMAQIQLRLGDVNARIGSLDVAQHHFESASTGPLSEGELVELYTDWARLWARRGRHDLARAELDKLDGLVERRWAMVSIAHGLLAEDWETGESNIDAGLRLARETRDPSAEAAALSALAVSARRRGDLPLAIDRTRASIALVERIGDRHRHAALRDLLADLLHESGDDAAAAVEFTTAVGLFAEVGSGGLEPEVWKIAPW